jgi:hypothetical protein
MRPRKFRRMFPMERPLFRWNVARISGEFAERLDDMKFLELAAHELSFRSSSAAQTLHRQVSSAAESHAL